MRTLHADLLAAQKAPSATPYIPVVIENKVGDARRHDFTALDATANAGADHDACVAADASVTRVRMEGGNVKQQRVTNPAVGPWTSWNNLDTGRGSKVACTCHTSRVFVVYTDAAGTGIYFKESTDNGATYGAATLIVTAASVVLSLAVAMKNSTGDLMLIWSETTSALVKMKIRTGGAFGANIAATPTFNSVYGIGAVHGDDYNIVIAGLEITTSKPTVWSFTYGDGFNLAAGVQGSLDIQVQAENASGNAYVAPYITFTDCHRITYCSIESFTGGVTRTFRAYLPPLSTWTLGAYSWRSPLPTDYADGNGIALAAILGDTTGYLYESGVAIVRRSPLVAHTLDVTADVLSINITEEPTRMRGTLLLNNDGGQYAGPPAPMRVGALVDVAFGYYTASGNRSSTLPSMWIHAIEHYVTGGRSHVKIELESGWDLMARSIQRTSIVHLATTPQFVAGRIATRAGLTMSTNGASARAATVTPNWTISPQTDGRRAMLRVLELVADRIFMRTRADIRFTEPLVADAADYTFDATHPVRSLAYRTAPPPASEAHAFGAAAMGQSTTLADAEQGDAPIAIVRDITSTSAVLANATAVAHLRQQKLDERDGELVVQPHVGLELLDVIAIDQPLATPTTITARVAAIAWRYDKRKSLLDQALTLSPR